jgi:hypothetical protein
MKRRLIGAAGALVLLAACGGMGADTNPSVASKPGQFRLDEWSITADQPALTAGQHTITATNLGHLTHELVIVRATDAASLPTKADGSVDEDQLDAVKVGEIADVPAGASRHKSFRFGPGSYVAFCNVVGGMGSGMGMGNGMMKGMDHVHFAAGMHTEFTVTA